MEFIVIFAFVYILFVFFNIRKFGKRKSDVFFSLQQKSDEDSGLFFKYLENIKVRIYDLEEQKKYSLL